MNEREELRMALGKSERGRYLWGEGGPVAGQVSRKLDQLKFACRRPGMVHSMGLQSQTKQQQVAFGAPRISPWGRSEGGETGQGEC